MTANMMNPLERLPSETLVQIVELLQPGDVSSPSSVFNLLFIKKFKPAAETVLYRSITLRGPGSYKARPWKVTRRLIDRIQNSNDIVSSRIRELVIEEWNNDFQSGFDAKSLESIIWSIENLQVLKTVMTQGTGVAWTSENLSRL